MGIKKLLELHFSKGRRNPVGNREAIPEKAIIQWVSFFSEQGKRKEQEDSYGVEETENGVFAVVADGIGGLSEGKDSSSFVVGFALKCMRSLKDIVEEEYPNYFFDMVHGANTGLLSRIKEQKMAKSGSTLLAAAFFQNRLFWVSVGDSRLYLMRDNRVYSLTVDHAYRQHLFKKAAEGEITVEKAAADPAGDALTSFMGIHKLKEIDRNIKPLHLKSGDRVLLCTDGIYKALTESRISELLQLEEGQAAKKMKEAVIGADAENQDNYTAIIIAY